MSFRPKRICTLAAMVDQLNHLLTNGVSPQAKVLIETDVGLELPTICVYDADEPAFVTLAFWTDAELIANSKHCDDINVPPYM